MPTVDPYRFRTPVLPLEGVGPDSPYTYILFQVLARLTTAPILAILPSISGLIRGCLQLSIS